RLGLLHPRSAPGREDRGFCTRIVPARPRGDRARRRLAARCVRALVGATHLGESPAHGRRRVRASRLVAAAVVLVLAAVLALLAADVRAWRETLRADDLRFQLSGSSESDWETSTLVPKG